ncbi:MAG TPA: hypothetical protein H9875_07310 [Candidatus Levilactobacillus faecigallinarum]|uniref:Uncharacterized protein n=1 Tax=Candidatus Levilactobacillus faecigallinarum TaxID=2838638 RepID=A0A9D1U5G6_9LACO|nr:hypothetical protein [Candidatus Levilactobacillus faecigallinarum]
MDNPDALLEQIIQRVKELPSPSTRGRTLPTSDYIEAQKFAMKLNDAYSDAKFEAVRHSPEMYLEIHKY